ncbi:MAG TPA: hypothetical protein VNT53_03455, partial [Pseudolysinimonas sp.]|nr:hypothetical protein [Pseudolysinimonas sp.]
MTSEAASAGRPPGGRARRDSGELIDGEWHRLHPATPLLRGGIALFAIIGILVANLREQLLELLIPGDDCRGDECDGGDPVTYLIDKGYLLLALAIVLGIVLIFVAFFALSWRMHTFRITDELVEVRSGILFRTHRKGRL